MISQLFRVLHAMKKNFIQLKESFLFSRAEHENIGKSCKGTMKGTTRALQGHCKGAARALPFITRAPQGRGRAGRAFSLGSCAGNTLQREVAPVCAMNVEQLADHKM